MSLWSVCDAGVQLLLLLLALGRAGSLPVPTDVPMCSASDSAQYRLTFSGKWTQAAFPKQYPVYRPPAQWSNIIGESSCCSLISVPEASAGCVVRETNTCLWLRGDAQLRLPHLAEERVCQ